MAIQSVLEEVKVALKFTKGSQTIGHCNKQASDESLHTLGMAIGSLNAEALQSITKVTEALLLVEA